MPWTASILTDRGRREATCTLPKTASAKQVLGALLAKLEVPHGSIAFWVMRNADAHIRPRWVDNSIQSLIDAPCLSACTGPDIRTARQKRDARQGHAYGDWPAMLPRSANGIYEGVTPDEANDVARVLMTKYPGLRLDLRSRGDDGFAVEVFRLQVKTPGEGVGSAAMKDLQDWAGKSGVALVLTPEANPRKKAALERFYRRHGFKPNSGRNTDFRLSSPFAPTWVWKSRVYEALTKGGNTRGYVVKAIYTPGGNSAQRSQASRRSPIAALAAPFQVYIAPNGEIAPGEQVSTPSIQTNVTQDILLDHKEASRLVSIVSHYDTLSGIKVVPFTELTDAEKATLDALERYEMRAWDDLEEAVLKGGREEFAVTALLTTPSFRDYVYAECRDGGLFRIHHYLKGECKYPSRVAADAAAAEVAKIKGFTEVNVVPYARAERDHLPSSTYESSILPSELWHGTCSGDLRGGTTGLHLGSRLVSRLVSDVPIAEATMRGGRQKMYAVYINTDVGYACGLDGRDAPADNAEDAWLYPESQAEKIRQRVSKWGDSADLVSHEEWKSRLHEAVVRNGRIGTLKPIEFKDFKRRFFGCGYDISSRDFVAAAGDLDGLTYVISPDDSGDYNAEDPHAVFTYRFKPGSNEDPVTSYVAKTGTKEECVEWLKTTRVTR